ncbi:MAG: porin family protein [Spiribacter sp.]|nr:porin family protein [Spiribacter sp.]MDR9490274.1 porin family protein [Spiribacter sp.]
MRIVKLLPLSLILAGMTTPALAVEQGETYLGGGLGYASYDETGIEEANPTALIGRLGYGLADHIAIEGRLGFGLTDDDIDVLGINVDVNIEQIAGVYAVGYLPLAEQFSLYGLAGLTYAEGSIDVVGLNFDGDDTDFSYGVGAQIDMSENVSGFLEWVQYLDESSYEVSAITLGASYHF